MAAAPCRQAPSPLGGPEPAVGSATVELAAAIPLLVAVTLAMVGLLGLARDHVLAQGAAREAAREAAVGGGETGPRRPPARRSHRVGRRRSRSWPRSPTGSASRWSCPSASPSAHVPW
jgi:hypothetical protein